MATVFVGARIPPSLYDKLSEYLDLVGATKSEILTAALAQYLGATEDLPLSQRVAVLEAHTKELQNEIARLEQRLVICCTK
jgi:predicted DNA-binding protein